MDRTALLILPFLGACGMFGPSSEDRDRLALFQANASLYYEGKRYDQALVEVEKGLEIDPYDYRLLSTAGWCWLFKAEGSEELLLRSEQYFDDLYASRSPEDHGPPVLLGYALCKQRLGVIHDRRARQLTAEAQGIALDEAAKVVREARATEHAGKARAYLASATKGFEALVEREETLRFAYKGLMEISVLEGDYQNAVYYGDLCLQRIDRVKSNLLRIIETTQLAAYEREKRAERDELIAQELRVRSALAEMHFRQENYRGAVEHLDMLLVWDPSRDTDYYNRGRAYEALGEHERARSDYDKFLQVTELPMNNERVQHAWNYTRRTSGLSR